MLYAGALTLALGTALLAVPVHILFSFRRAERVEGSATAVWFFGLIRVPIPIKREKPDPKPSQPVEKPGEAKAANPKSAGWGLQKPLAVIRNGPFRRRVIQFITDMAGAIKVSEAKFHAVAGLDDPADTGMLCGAMYPLLAALNLPRSSAVSIQPDFTGEIFQFTGSGNVRIVPLEVLFILVLFILSPPALKMIWIIKPWKR